MTVAGGGGAAGSGADSVGSGKVVIGGNGLKPGLTISVDASGIPARPALRAGGVGVVPTPVVVVPAMGLLPVAHAVEAMPAMPPPSNSVVGEGTPGVAVVQPFAEVGGGLIPGVASSMAPRGMPTGVPTPVDVLLLSDPPDPGVIGVESNAGSPCSSSWTCATAQPQARRTAAVAPTTTETFMLRRPEDVALPASAGRP